MQSEALMLPSSNKSLNMGSGQMVPVSMDYGEAADFAVDGKTEIIHFPAENPSDFSSQNNTIRINVLSSDRFIDLRDSRLAFDIEATGTSPVHRLDGGAACVIRTLIIKSPQGTELERIDSYNLLHAVLDQYETTLHDVADKNAKEGSIRYFDPEKGYETDLCDHLFSAGALDINANQQKHYEVHLKGGWFNTKLQKLLPPGIQFQIEIVLEQANYCLYMKDTTAAKHTLDYKVKNVLFKAPVVSITDPSVMSAVKNMTGRGYHWMGKSYRLYTNTLVQGEGDATIPISDRSHSLEALLTVFRTQTRITSPLEQSLTTRTTQILDRFQAILGSTHVPPQPIELKTTALGANQNPAYNADYQNVVNYLGWNGAWTFTSVNTVIAGATFATFTMAGADALDLRSALVPGQKFRFSTAAAATALDMGEDAVWTIFQATKTTIVARPYEYGAWTNLAAAGVSLTTLGFELQNPMGMFNELSQHVVNYNISQAYAEMKRVFPAPALVSAEQFQQSEPRQGIGVVCLNLKTFKDADRIMSGKDTATQSVPISIQLHKTAACTQPMQVDTFAVLDRAWYIGPGGVLDTAI